MTDTDHMEWLRAFGEQVAEQRAEERWVVAVDLDEIAACFGGTNHNGERLWTGTRWSAIPSDRPAVYGMSEAIQVSNWLAKVDPMGGIGIAARPLA